MIAADIPLQNDVEEHCRKEGRREGEIIPLIGGIDRPANKRYAFLASFWENYITDDYIF